MGTKKAQTLRFAAGTPDEPRSSIWSVIAQRDEVYLGPRVMMRFLKLSLHSSGIWRAAWNAQSGIVSTRTGERLENRWVQPQEFAPGWTQGPSVRVPWSFETKRLTDEPPRKRVVWISGPREGTTLIFTVLFSAPGVPLRDRRRVIREGDREVGRLPLADGRSVWVFAREQPQSDEERDAVRAMVADMKVHVSNDPESVSAAVVYSIDTDPLGFPGIWDLALGSENVTTDPPPPRPS